MERGESPLVRGVYDSVELDKQGGNVQVAIGAGVMKRYEAAFVLGIDVGPVFKEKFGDLQIIVTSC